LKYLAREIRPCLCQSPLHNTRCDMPFSKIV
jgi:hypothetical protein